MLVAKPLGVQQVVLVAYPDYLARHGLPPVQHYPRKFQLFDEKRGSVLKKPELSSLSAFVAIAQERSFRKGAIKLGVTPSTLSHAMRELETQLGIRLLNRTTRNVSPTEAGEHLLGRLSPAFTDIATALDSLNAFRDKPQGMLQVRVSADQRLAIVATPEYLRQHSRPTTPHVLRLHRCIGWRKV